MRISFRRALTASTSIAAGAGVGLAVFLGTAPAHAAAIPGPPAAPGTADLAAAAKSATADQAQSMAARFFVHLDQRAAHVPIDTASTADITAAAMAKAPRVTGPAIPVYSLHPAFVSSPPGTTPVAEVAHLAVETDSASGQQATVRLEQRGTGYQVQGIVQGTDELRYARQADGALAFVEPQLNAWYKVSGGRILPLNDAARASVGKDGTTLAAYQQLVHTRYADKLPGSAYVSQHKLGGYTAAAPATAPQAGDATQRLLLAGTGGLAAAAGTALGAGLLTRRRADAV